MSSSLFSSIATLAAERGLDLIGALSADRFDASQPVGRRVGELLVGCGTVCVFGSAGDSHWQALEAEAQAPITRAPNPRYNPLQDHAAATGSQLLDLLRHEGVHGRVVMAEDSDAPNMVQLAECAGLGTTSPVLGLLLHPEFGPWISLRFALLLEGMPFGRLKDAELADAFQPCRNCSKPCIKACPALAFDGQGGQSFEACAHWRHAGGCSGGCDVRRACPVGAAYRYGPNEERFRHAYSLQMMRRHFGLGMWRFVPKAVRQR